jgi:pyruvate kinase
MQYPQANHDAHLETLKQLLIDVRAVKETVVAEAEKRLAPYTAYYRSGVLTKSAVNLAHYLALRQLDLRHLQLRLAQVGLSSLGRAEASVLSTLDAVIDLLSRATGDLSASDSASSGEYDFNRGHQLLDQHTIELFGPYYEKSKAHVMVTLGTDAAWDYALINRLLEQGMTCARINCAHDDHTVWQAMIGNIRRAEAETGRSCRILMDLAGHKIRTGQVALGPAIRHLKVKRDERGQCLVPAQFIIARHSVETLDSEASDQPLIVPLQAEFFDQLALGQHIRCKDLRGKHREFELVQSLDANQWLLSGTEGCYLAAGTALELLDCDHNQLAAFNLGDFEGQPAKIILHQGDHLLLTTLSQAGAPAELNQAGQVCKPAQIGCTLESAISHLKEGDPVWIDDGKLGAEVESILEEGALLRVTRARSQGVNIKADKGINFPETDLGLPSLSEKDLHDLDFACINADLIGFSFVESLADMDNLIQELAKRGATDLPIIAKIETNRAVKNLPDIVLGTLGRHSLGIMIARGDLAVELGSARLAEVQEELLWLCEAAHVPVIWATQVLESIAKKGTRSRPEFTDAAMAVRAECVMLNKGPYIVDALSALINVMDRMQAHQHKKFSRLRALHW